MVYVLYSTTFPTLTLTLSQQVPPSRGDLSVPLPLKVYQSPLNPLPHPLRLELPVTSLTLATVHTSTSHFKVDFNGQHFPNCVHEESENGVQ